MKARLIKKIVKRAIVGDLEYYGFEKSATGIWRFYHRTDLLGCNKYARLLSIAVLTDL